MPHDIPDFTIVTPSYNYHEYIREMLDSVVAQEAVSYEHLIYDAGSTDGTLNIIREYEHVKLTVEPDKGMTDAINKGFRVAKGKWVMWLNTDDRLKPGALLAFKKFAEKHESADVIYGAWDFIDGDGHYQRTMATFPFQKLMLTHHSCYIASTSTFFRRDSTIGEGLFLNKKFMCAMDGEYYCRLASLGKTFIHFPKALADFRMHGENISQKHLDPKDLNQVLSRQRQLAEGRTIRRYYGWTLFNNDHLNSVVDCLLFYVLKLQKGILKLLNKPSS
jgi:glycosyltransferase involved in cell wall biosynthesis